MIDLLAYRIRLKGTELYYQPIKGRWNGKKSNLAIRGKVYLIKPALPDPVGCEVSDTLVSKYSLRYSEKNWRKGQKYLSDEYKFELVTYKLVEEEV